MRFGQCPLMIWLRDTNRGAVAMEWDKLNSRRRKPIDDATPNDAFAAPPVIDLAT